MKSNPFLTYLSAITAVVCVVLFYLASKSGGEYDDAKTAFDESYAVVQDSEGIPLYPTVTNRDSKVKALKDYRQSIEELRIVFDKFRSASLENVKPQVFADRLKKANKEVSDACGAAKCTLPDKFFLGFDTYSTGLAKEEATGALSYELGGIRHALLGLAKSRPSQIISIYRESLPEENGGSFQPKPNDVARNFSVELTFKGSEASARKFLTYLGETDPYYYVVRCVKISNDRETPPKVSDAKFENDKPAAAPQQTDIFRDVFLLPEAQPAPGTPAPAPGAAQNPAPAPEDPAAEKVDTSRILAQVLGSEEIIVFVRLDIAMFLPSKELPKP